MAHVSSIGFAPNGHVQFQYNTDVIDVCVTIELEELEYIIHRAKKIAYKDSLMEESSAEGVKEQNDT